MESLETRTLLDANANLSMVGSAYLVDELDRPFDMAKVPEGLPVFIHKRFTTTNLPFTGRDLGGTYYITNTVDELMYGHPGGWPWGVGVPGTSRWYEYWGGWTTTPGLHYADTMIDAFDNFEETNEGDNSDSFTFTTIPKPLVTIEALSSLATEAGETPGAFTITRIGNANFDMPIQYSLGGTATANDDYAQLPATLFMAAGETTLTVPVTPVNDATAESRESVTLTLIPQLYYAVPAIAAATVEIKDNDATVTIAATKPDASEGGPVAGEFSVTRDGDTADALTVMYTVSGTATSGADYPALSGQVTISAGQHSATIAVVPKDDVIAEPTESVSVKLTRGASGGDSAYETGEEDEATVEIGDNDTVVTIAATKPVALEAGTSAALLIVTRAGPTADPLVVHYSVGGTAKSDADYAPHSGQVTIAAGASSATIAVVPKDDDVTEPRETVTVTITDKSTVAEGAYKAGNPKSATVGIKDNDTVVTIAAAKPIASEIGPTAGQFVLTRKGDVADALTVNYAVSGTATPNTDYAALAGTVVFAAGASTVAILVTPVADKVQEPAESVIVRLIAEDTGSESRYLVGDPGDALVQIADSTPVTSRGNAQVESHLFDSSTLMLPKPITGATYTLSFLAWFNIGPGADGVTRKFHWSVDASAGFTLKGDKDGAVANGRLQSEATGTIDSAVREGVVYTVTVEIKPPIGFTVVRKQQFTFYGVEIAAAKPVVLVGGLDDDLHQTSIKVKRPSAGIPSDSDLTIKLESNQDYGQRIKPSVFKRSGTWFFRSSDRAFAPDHDSNFQLGATIIPSLTGKPVKVATANVAQNPGDYRMTVVQPKSGQIYPNGAIKIRVQHLFNRKPTSHEFDVELSRDVEAKVGKRYRDEFNIRGDKHGSYGDLTTEVIKLQPKRTDPKNLLFSVVKLKFTDPAIFDESGAPMDFASFAAIKGELPSFWRASAAHGKGERGTFWNWATVVGQPGSGFKGTQESTPTGTYGVSETWRGKDYETDSTVAALEALTKPIVAELSDLARSQRDWNRVRDKLNSAVVDYLQFKNGFKVIKDLKPIYDTIAGLVSKGKELSKLAKELAAQLRKEKDPAKIVEIAKQLNATYEQLATLNKQVKAAFAKRDEILASLAKGFKPQAPYVLVMTADAALNDLATMQPRIDTIRVRLGRLSQSLGNFINDLSATIWANRQKSGDPDETLKREYILGEEDEQGRLEALVAQATAMKTSVDDAGRRAAALASSITVLTNRVAEAKTHAILGTLEELLTYVLKKVPFSGTFEAIADWLGYPIKLDAIITGFVGQGLEKTLDTLVDDIAAATIASQKAIDSTQAIGDLARAAIPPSSHLYRVWITPTVEFPASVLSGLKPKLK